MDKRSKIALYSIAAIVLFMIVAELVKPKAINWRDSYSAQDKIPLGCHIVYNELDTFTDQDILNTNEDFYGYSKRIDTTKKSTAIFINNYVSFYGEESDAILKYVNRGNSVFVSTTSFSGDVADTLNINLRKNYSFLKVETLQEFTSKSQNINSKTFKDIIENSYLSSIDTLNTTVLGTMTLEEDDEAEINFIKVPFGENEGAFYIHSNPFAFSNYHLLNDKEDYAATVLSYLPKNQIIWDNYHKSGRRFVQSPIRYIIEQEALKWAFYLAILALILFVIFKGKRTQRIVPVIEPLQNSTVEFTKTIGGLYFQQGEYSNIIDKKITFFLEHIRTHYYLNTETLDQNFIEKLALKAVKNPEETKQVIYKIRLLKERSEHSESDLIALNKILEQFTKT